MTDEWNFHDSAFFLYPQLVHEKLARSYVKIDTFYFKKRKENVYLVSSWFRIFMSFFLLEYFWFNQRHVNQYLLLIEKVYIVWMIKRSAEKKVTSQKLSTTSLQCFVQWFLGMIKINFTVSIFYFYEIFIKNNSNYE